MLYRTRSFQGFCKGHMLFCAEDPLPLNIFPFVAAFFNRLACLFGLYYFSDFLDFYSNGVDFDIQMEN
jgi:hypothetical protein